MKHFFAVLLLSVSALLLHAQSNQRSLLYNFIADKKLQGVAFSETNLFNQSRTEYVSDSIVSNFTGLSLNKRAISDLFTMRPAGIRLSLPVKQQQNFELVLAVEQINTSGDFVFGILGGDHQKTKVSADQGLHYRGYIAGDSSSMACISVFENGELMGVFANRDGNFVIGRMKNSDQYVLYKSSDMPVQPRYECATSELSYPAATNFNQSRPASTTASAPPPPPNLCKKVRIYWEADYHLYEHNFSSDLTRTQNYLLGLFNIVASIYQNEGIIIELSKTFVWTSTDPYSNTNSSAGLNSFKSYWNKTGDNYDGDLAHLVAGGTTNNGGLAFILNFDQCNRPYTYGYSNVYANFQAYPNYSWDAQVLSHETGHNMGSNHTHWCGWNTGPGNTCGAIDNCSAFETGGGCSTCFTSTDINNLPAGFKGTIMSYCYLKNGIGVSFVNGFGPLPQAVIRNNVSAAACFTKRNVWTGAVNTAWENTGNWSCGELPDASTDVVIGKGLTNYPTVNSTDAICRSINETAGASIRVNANFHLTIAGKGGN